MGESGTDHRETMTLGVPAINNERDKPITPSPVIRPLPVLQALRITKSAFNFRLRISSAVSKPSSWLLGASAIALCKPWKSSNKPWVAK